MLEPERDEWKSLGTRIVQSDFDQKIEKSALGQNFPQMEQFLS
jgi:hypothetical protein